MRSKAHLDRELQLKQKQVADSWRDGTLVSSAQLAKTVFRMIVYCPRAARHARAASFQVFPQTFIDDPLLKLLAWARRHRIYSNCSQN